MRWQAACPPLNTQGQHLGRSRLVYRRAYSTPVAQTKLVTTATAAARPNSLRMSISGAAGGGTARRPSTICVSCAICQDASVACFANAASNSDILAVTVSMDFLSCSSSAAAAFALTSTRSFFARTAAVTGLFIGVVLAFEAPAGEPLMEPQVRSPKGRAKKPGQGPSDCEVHAFRRNGRTRASERDDTERERASESAHHRRRHTAQPVSQ